MNIVVGIKEPVSYKKALCCPLVYNLSVGYLDMLSLIATGTNNM